MSRKHEVLQFRTQPPKQNTLILPHVAFYLDVHRPIKDAECTFPKSHLFKRGNRSFCHNAHISLVYRVNLMRSLSNQIAASSTPDAKLVRISLDADSVGSGIQLNQALGIGNENIQNALDGVSVFDIGRLNDWKSSYSTGAIAKDYTFSIVASNNIPSILKTYPISNLNKNYEHRDTSGIEIGVSASIENTVSEGAKLKLEGKYAYQQSRTLVFKNQDYRVERSSVSPQHIAFTWAREEYATAKSLLHTTTAPMWGDSNPIDLSRIQPLGYKGFVPNFDVIYKAGQNASGKTTFSINSSVNLWAIYAATYRHYYLFSHLSFQAQEPWQQYRRIGKTISFEVDWDHPVFFGARPVNLQSGIVNNQCIRFQEGSNAVQLVTCDIHSVEQSFIYDKYGRYISAKNTRYCLDGQNLQKFALCNSNLSQKWTWYPNSNALQNTYYKTYLGHNTFRDTLFLAGNDNPAKGSNIIFMTQFTDIFSQTPPPQPGLDSVIQPEHIRPPYTKPYRGK